MRARDWKVLKSGRDDEVEIGSDRGKEKGLESAKVLYFLHRYKKSLKNAIDQIRM